MPSFAKDEIAIGQIEAIIRYYGLDEKCRDEITTSVKEAFKRKYPSFLDEEV
jgi:hypothetical protein